MFMYDHWSKLTQQSCQNWNSLWSLWCAKGLVPECSGSFKNIRCSKEQIWWFCTLLAQVSKFKGFIRCHVANFFWRGTKNFKEDVINVLKKTFKTSQEEFKNFNYLGLHIEQKQDCMYLDQQMYIGELQEVQFCKERKIPKEILLNTDDPQQLRGQAWQLLWTSSQTRSEMSFGACKVSVSVADAKSVI